MSASPQAFECRAERRVRRPNPVGGLRSYDDIRFNAPAVVQPAVALEGGHGREAQADAAVAEGEPDRPPAAAAAGGADEGDVAPAFEGAQEDVGRAETVLIHEHHDRLVVVKDSLARRRP